MAIRLSFLLALPAFLFFSCDQKTKTATDNFSETGQHDLVSELRLLHDISLLPRFIDSSYVAQVSSYDTTGGNDDGFSGRYSFLERKPDSSLVIFRVQGNGVINRIWTPTPNTDTLDFYFGGKQRPDFSIRFIDLFSGKQSPFNGPLCGNQVGGYYCYLPIPFENGCTIVTRGKKIQFHQIQYRLYQDSQPVKKFSTNLSEDEKNELEKISKLYNQTPKTFSAFSSGANGIKEEAGSFQLKSGGSQIIFQKNGGGRVLGIELAPAEVFEGLSKDIDIKVSWDDESTPAIYCPVADFFGFAFGKSSMRSLLIGTDNNTCYSFFPMPFGKSAKIEIISRKPDSAEPIQVSSKIYYSEEKQTNGEGKLYTAWNSNKPKVGEPHIFASLRGKGHYVGSILQSQGLKAGMTYFFEGDDSTVIDGSLRMHGTGSEDYFNGGWYALMDRWEGQYSLPLHGALDYSLPFCRTGGYRLFISDKMTFSESLFHSIEHGPTGNSFPVQYTSLAFYYGESAPGKIISPDIENAQVYQPDSLYLYTQLMDINLDGKVNLETMWKYGTGGLSFKFTVEDESTIRFSLAEIPDGTYSLGVDVIENPMGCSYTVWQRQTQVSELIATSNQKETRNTRDVVPELVVNRFKKTLTFQFKTDKSRNVFLLNRLSLIRKN